jgi:hypothetical protein
MFSSEFLNNLNIFLLQDLKIIVYFLHIFAVISVSLQQEQFLLIQHPHQLLLHLTLHPVKPCLITFGHPSNS